MLLVLAAIVYIVAVICFLISYHCDTMYDSSLTRGTSEFKTYWRWALLKSFGWPVYVVWLGIRFLLALV